MATVEHLHNMQREHMEQDMLKTERADIHAAWFRDDTVDYWLHKRMYEMIAPLALHYQDKQWVSIGDGRYGLDSVRMKRLFDLDIFPTDISENMLRHSKELGLLTSYGVENAESLTFADNSFDVVFCKEALHHCPRPLVALYEMLRVARECVILIEPNDGIVLEKPKRLLSGFINAAISVFAPRERRPSVVRSYAVSFEPSGNYVYGLSLRETLKIAQALNLAGVAWKGFNSSYTPGCEFEVASPENAVYQTTVRNIQKQDNLVRRFPLFLDYGLAAVAIFKGQLDATLKSTMVAGGYQFPQLAKNPYL